VIDVQVNNAGVGFTSVLLSRFVLQNISGLALQSFADCFECGEPDRFGLAVFEDGDIGHSDAHLVSKLGDAHLAPGKHDVDIDDNWHCLYG